MRVGNEMGIFGLFVANFPPLLTMELTLGNVTKSVVVVVCEVREKTDVVLQRKCLTFER